MLREYQRKREKIMAHKAIEPETQEEAHIDYQEHQRRHEELKKLLLGVKREELSREIIKMILGLCLGIAGFSLLFGFADLRVALGIFLAIWGNNYRG